MQWAGLALVLVLGGGLTATDEDALKKDLETLQGTWAVQAVLDGQPHRITKTIEGNTETYAITRDGEVVYEHRVDFRLERSGSVRLFVFSNQVVTAGPQKGMRSDREGAYIYKVIGDRFYEVDGFLDDQREWAEEPQMIRWDRVVDR